MSKDIFDYIKENNISEVKLLLDHGADVNVKDEDGETPLFCASNNGHKEIVKLLLEHGADVNAKNNYGNSPLHCVSEKGHTEIVNIAWVWRRC